MIGPGQRNHTLSDGCVPSHKDQDDVDDATVAQAIADLRRNRPSHVAYMVPKADYDALRTQFADYQRGAAEEARQGDLAREEVHDLKAQLAAAMAVVRAATAVDTCTYTSVKCRDGNCHGRLHLALITALDQLSRPTEEK